MSDQEAAGIFGGARAEGHTAILADEQAADELRLQLANVPAGADVEITTEIIAMPAVREGRGSLVLPLISGPKYGGSEARQSDIDPLAPETRAPTCHLDLRLHVAEARIDVGRIEGDRIRCEIPPVGQVTIDFDAEPAALYHEDDSGRYLVVGVPPFPREEGRAWGETAVRVHIDGKAAACGHLVRGRPLMLALTPEAPLQSVTLELPGRPATEVGIFACPEARPLWARQRVMDIVRRARAEGQTIDQRSDEIRALGLEHQILTPFTAMVGVDVSRTCDRTGTRPIVAQASLPVGIDDRAFTGPGSCLHRTHYKGFAVSLPGDALLNLRRADRRSTEGGEQGAAEEAGRLLAAILRGAKTSGEAAGLELLIGPWIALYSPSAIALAAMALWNAGCNALGALLIWEARLSLAAVNRSEMPAGRLLTLAEEIADRLRQGSHRL